MKVCLIGYCMNAATRARLKWGWRGAAGDIAIWNTMLIETLSKRDDIELHVIAPANHMAHLTQEFEIGRVHYHYFKPDAPFLHINWMHLGRLDQRTNYWLTRHIVQKWVRKINPDIVNLTGAENPHYSTSILGLKDYPVYISMQGIYSNPIRFKTEKKDVWREKFERWVHRENRYFGLNAEFMKELILRDAPKDSCLFWTRPLNKEADLSQCRSNEKKFDFVFFSRMNRNKGSMDVLKAAAIVKKTHPNLKILFTSRGHGEFWEKFEAEMRELGLSDNVTCLNGFAQHDDLMREVAKAKYHILPTYIDTIPCTIFEGLRLGLPFVGYKTGDIPKLNIGDERVLLANQGDVDTLAKQMLRLMEDDKFAADLRDKAMSFVDRYFSNSANVEQLLKCYRAVIDNYHNGTPIPAGLLYDEYLNGKIKDSSSEELEGEKGV